MLSSTTQSIIYRLGGAGVAAAVALSPVACPDILARGIGGNADGTDAHAASTPTSSRLRPTSAHLPVRAALRRLLAHPGADDDGSSDYTGTSSAGSAAMTSTDDPFATPSSSGPVVAWPGRLLVLSGPAGAGKAACVMQAVPHRVLAIDARGGHGGGVGGAGGHVGVCVTAGRSSSDGPHHDTTTAPGVRSGDGGEGHSPSPEDHDPGTLLSAAINSTLDRLLVERLLGGTTAAAGAEGLAFTCASAWRSAGATMLRWRGGGTRGGSSSAGTGQLRSSSAHDLAASLALLRASLERAREHRARQTELQQPGIQGAEEPHEPHHAELVPAIDMFSPDANE